MLKRIDDRLGHQDLCFPCFVFGYAKLPGKPIQALQSDEFDLGDLRQRHLTHLTLASTQRVRHIPASRCRGPLQHEVHLTRVAVTLVLDRRDELPRLGYSSWDSV